MSVNAQRTLRSAITTRRFDPVYYLHGDDDFRKASAVEELLASALDPAVRDFNLDTFRGSDASPDRLSAALAALPMLAERRVVVVSDVAALKKGSRSVLDAYLCAPAVDTVLVLVAYSGTPMDDNLAKDSTSVPFPSLAEGDVVVWLTQRARKAGVEITADAAALLARSVEADLAHAAGEIEKLASYTNGGAINAAAVEAVAGVRQDAVPGMLFDAVAARDAARAHALVGPVLAQPKTTAASIVNALATQVLAMGWGRAQRDAGTSPARLKGEYFALLKSRGGNPGRPWGEAVQCWTSHLGSWTADDLARAADHLLVADLALKDTRGSSDEDVLSTLVLALCAPSPGRRAA
jgi:DNA polymerase-3 subunit delta